MNGACQFSEPSAAVGTKFQPAAPSNPAPPLSSLAPESTSNTTPSEAVQPTACVRHCSTTPSAPDPPSTQPSVGVEAKSLHPTAPPSQPQLHAHHSGLHAPHHLVLATPSWPQAAATDEPMTAAIAAATSAQTEQGTAATTPPIAVLPPLNGHVSGRHGAGSHQTAAAATAAATVKAPSFCPAPSPSPAPHPAPEQLSAAAAYPPPSSAPMHAGTGGQDGNSSGSPRSRISGAVGPQIRGCVPRSRQPLIALTDNGSVAANGRQQSITPPELSPDIIINEARSEAGDRAGVSAAEAATDPASPGVTTLAEVVFPAGGSGRGCEAEANDGQAGTGPGRRGSVDTSSGGVPDSGGDAVPTTTTTATVDTAQREEAVAVAAEPSSVSGSQTGAMDAGVKMDATGVREQGGEHELMEEHVGEQNGDGGGGAETFVAVSASTAARRRRAEVSVGTAPHQGSEQSAAVAHEYVPPQQQQPQQLLLGQVQSQGHRNPVQRQKSRSGTLWQQHQQQQQPSHQQQLYDGVNSTFRTLPIPFQLNPLWPAFPFSLPYQLFQPPPQQPLQQLPPQQQTAATFKIKEGSPNPTVPSQTTIPHVTSHQTQPHLDTLADLHSSSVTKGSDPPPAFGPRLYPAALPLLAPVPAASEYEDDGQRGAMPTPPQPLGIPGPLRGATRQNPSLVQALVYRVADETPCGTAPGGPNPDKNITAPLVGFEALSCHQQQQQQQQQCKHHQAQNCDGGGAGGAAVAAASAALVGVGIGVSEAQQVMLLQQQAARRRSLGSGSAAAAAGRQLPGGPPAGSSGGSRLGSRPAIGESSSFKYIVQVGDKWRAQVGHMEGGVQRKYYSAYVRSAAAAARDADKLLYKLRGPDCPLNFPLTAGERRWLDNLSLQDLLQQLHPSHDSPALMAAAALLDLSRHHARGEGKDLRHPQPPQPPPPALQPTQQNPAPAATAMSSGSGSDPAAVHEVSAVARGHLLQGGEGPTLEGCIQASSPVSCSKRAAPAAAQGLNRAPPSGTQESCFTLADTVGGHGGNLGSGGNHVKAGPPALRDACATLSDAAARRTAALGGEACTAGDCGLGKDDNSGGAKGVELGTEGAAAAPPVCPLPRIASPVTGRDTSGSGDSSYAKYGRGVVAAVLPSTAPPPQLPTRFMYDTTTRRVPIALEGDCSGGASASTRDTIAALSTIGTLTAFARQAAGTAFQDPVPAEPVALKLSLEAAATAGIAVKEEPMDDAAVFAALTSPKGQATQDTEAVHRVGGASQRMNETTAAAVKAEGLRETCRTWDGGTEAGGAAAATTDRRDVIHGSVSDRGSGGAGSTCAVGDGEGDGDGRSKGEANSRPEAAVERGAGVPWDGAARERFPVCYPSQCEGDAGSGQGIGSQRRPSGGGPSTSKRPSTSHQPPAHASHTAQLALQPPNFPPLPTFPFPMPFHFGFPFGLPMPVPMPMLPPPPLAFQMAAAIMTAQSHAAVAAAAAPVAAGAGPLNWFGPGQVVGPPDSIHAIPVATEGPLGFGHASAAATTGWAHTMPMLPPFLSMPPPPLPPSEPLPVQQTQTAPQSQTPQGQQQQQQQPLQQQLPPPPPPQQQKQQHKRQQQGFQQRHLRASPDRDPDPGPAGGSSSVPLRRPQPSASEPQPTPPVCPQAQPALNPSHPNPLSHPPAHHLHPYPSHLNQHPHARQRPSEHLNPNPQHNTPPQPHSPHTALDQGEVGDGWAAADELWGRRGGAATKHMARKRKVAALTCGSGSSGRSREGSDEEASAAAAAAAAAETGATFAAPLAVLPYGMSSVSAMGDRAGHPRRSVPPMRPSMYVDGSCAGGGGCHPDRLSGACLHHHHQQLGSSARPSNMHDEKGPGVAAAAAAAVFERPTFRYIVRIGCKWRAQVGHTEDGVQRKYYSNYVDDPRVAAKDADRILYKLRGPAAVANLPLSEVERQALDCMSLQGLLRSFKSDQRQHQL